VVPPVAGDAPAGAVPASPGAVLAPPAPPEPGSPAATVVVVVLADPGVEPGVDVVTPGVVVVAPGVVVVAPGVVVVVVVVVGGTPPKPCNGTLNGVWVGPNVPARVALSAPFALGVKRRPIVHVVPEPVADVQLWVATLKSGALGPVMLSELIGLATTAVLLIVTV
jgi:hypothetical protein